MDKKIWGVIGGIALVLALLSPFVLGSTKKVEQIFEDAEELYERSSMRRPLQSITRSSRSRRRLV